MIKWYTSHKRGVIMLKDRGNKKWTSLMLTEHRDGLREIWNHRDDVNMPVLDEQKLEELELVLQEAIQNNKFVEVTYYKNRRHHKVSGNIKVKNNYFVIEGKRIPVQQIIDIKIVF